MKVLVIGGGIAGIASAIALSRQLQQPPEITVLEIRNEPSTMGGSIGLTPNALRCLYYLGVFEVIEKRNFGITVETIELFNMYTKALLGKIDFTEANGRGVGEPAFKGRRIMRSDLLTALLETAKSHGNVNIVYGKRTTKIIENSSEITVTTEDGQSYSADILLACDGIHSVVRKLLIDKDRTPEYTGIAAVSGFAEVRNGSKLMWKTTSLCQSRRGSLMSTYYEPTRTKQAISIVTGMEDVKSRDGWLARGAEQENLKNEVRERYGNSPIPGLDELIEDTASWSLYPVFKLGPRGVWCSQRALLLGDAAHAMPPQGESAAIAMEDAVIFSRILAAHLSSSPSDVFAAYEGVRRARIDQAYKEATFGWDTQKDSSWFAFQFRSLITAAFLWWTAKGRHERYSIDLWNIDLDQIAKA